jgi:Protein of unknown function (DUF1622)
VSVSVELLDLARFVVMLAVVVGVTGLVRGLLGLRRRDPAPLVESLGLTLEFLLAAGVLRLGARPDPEGLALVLAVIALRQLLTAGLRVGGRALSPSSAR